MRACLLALAAAAIAACAPRLGEGAPRTIPVAIGASQLRVEYLPEDADAARDVVEALQTAVPKAERWGPLRAPVTITLQPTHEALEQAVHREGYGWLRAWARYDTIDLQSPRTWSVLLPPDARELEELLAHELTHCVMYQAATSRWTWQLRSIPLWFREGMASVTAGQAHRRAGPQTIWAFYTSSAGSGGGSDGGAGPVPAYRGDPLTDPDPLYRSDAALVYDTAHLAFQFLIDRYGDARAARLLALMREGDDFGSAFLRAIGISHEAFGAEFRRYVAWKGWAR